MRLYSLIDLKIYQTDKAPTTVKNIESKPCFHIRTVIGLFYFFLQYILRFALNEMHVTKYSFISKKSDFRYNNVFARATRDETDSAYHGTGYLATVNLRFTRT